MKSDPRNALCYTCKFRQEIPGDCHSQCVHPKLQAVNEMPIAKLIPLLSQRLGCADIRSTLNPLNVTAEQHGVKMGWFNWPFNFDPVWMTNCDGYESIEGHQTGCVCADCSGAELTADND